MNNIIIFGNGEIASLSKYYFNSISKNIDFFCVDDQYVKETQFESTPIISMSELSKIDVNKNSLFVALSYAKHNQTREKKFNEIKKLGFKFESFVHKKSYISDNVTIGKNCLILENQTIQKDVKINDNVFIWSSNHIGHGSIIQSHTYISSHVVISGHCKIGKRCFLGVNSAIKDFTDVQDDVFISMGCNVTKNIDSGSVVINNTSEIFKKDDKRSVMLKKKFFK
jgi:sugar O-acyltransferase (sialic acid O-acetyltransferase NeuD family)